MLCDNLEGWMGWEVGEEAQEGGDIRVPMADSWRCMAETNKPLYIIGNLKQAKLFPIIGLYLCCLDYKDRDKYLISVTFKIN